MGAFYAPRAREGNQILQINLSKSVETIRGHPSAAHVLARRVAVLGEEVVAEVGVKVVAKVDSAAPRIATNPFFSFTPFNSGVREEVLKGAKVADLL